MADAANPCAVCWGELGTTNIREGLCGHVYHTFCIDEVKNANCPLCVAPFQEKLGTAEMCAICHIPLDNRCIVCESEKRVCIPASGECKCVFHEHCIRRWLVQRDTCPLCDTVFILIS